MAPYDSDDSLDDDQSFTETDVLLGYASKDSNGETISKLGGRPDWLDPSEPPSYTPTFQCAACSSPLVLLLQLNAELASRFPGHERRLYVFACRQKSCRRKDGSVRAVRAVRVSADAVAKAKERAERAEREKVERERDEAERREKENGLGEELFGVAKGAFGVSGAGANGNPFSMGSAGTGSSTTNPFAQPQGAANPFSSSISSPATTAPSKDVTTTTTTTTDEAEALPKTFAAALSLNNPQQTPSGLPPPPTPWPVDADLPSPYPVSYLAEADYETLDPTPPAVPQATSMQIDTNDNSSGGGKEDKDVFESTIDSIFQSFADRLAQNPDQCIRYEFGGAPLLYSKTDAVGRRLYDVPAGTISHVLPRCGGCGGGRVFEVQMTPRAIVELEEDEVLEGMDWGAVIVAVCERDCVPRGTREGEVGYCGEWVGVQWEELGMRR
ncbi:unnamed protein product [Discula destructiva]